MPERHVAMIRAAAERWGAMFAAAWSVGRRIARPHTLWRAWPLNGLSSIGRAITIGRGGCIGPPNGVAHVGCATAARLSAGAGVPHRAASALRAAASRRCALRARFRAASPQALQSVPAFRHLGDSVVPHVAQRRSPSSRRDRLRIGAGKPAGAAADSKSKWSGSKCSTAAADPVEPKLKGSCVCGEVIDGIQHECCTPKAVAGGVLVEAPPQPHMGSSQYSWKVASLCPPRSGSPPAGIRCQLPQRTSDGAAGGAPDGHAQLSQTQPPLFQSRPTPEAPTPLSLPLPEMLPQLPPPPPPSARTGIWR
eukprot:scaffold18772_cov112-Isochrysis_galbana.AAC.5